MSCLPPFTKYDNNFQNSNQAVLFVWGKEHAGDPPDGGEAVPRRGRARSKGHGARFRVEGA